MIFERPFDIVQMTADGVRPHAVKEILVIEQSQVFLDLGMAEVVPLSRVRRIQELKKIEKLAFRGHGLVVLAVLDADPDALLRCIGKNLA